MKQIISSLTIYKLLVCLLGLDDNDINFLSVTRHGYLANVGLFLAFSRRAGGVLGRTGGMDNV